MAARDNVPLDLRWVSTVSVGVAEPVVPHPRNADDAAKNRRVEFRIYKVSPDELSPLGVRE